MTQQQQERAARSLRIAALAVGMLLALPAAADTAVLGALSSPEPAAVGASVNVALSITGIADLYAWQFSLAFDPAVLQVSSISGGSFLSATGPTLFIPGTVDNVSGRIGFMIESFLGPSLGASGSGPLAQVSFDVVGLGTSAINFSDVVFLDSALQDIPVLAQAGAVTAVPEPASLLLMALGVAGLLAARRRD